MVASNNQIDELVEKVVNWHTLRYPELPVNRPSDDSLTAIRQLCERVLLPIEIEFGLVNVTYGFTSTSLINLIKRISPKGIAPNLDQHTSHEVNSKNIIHCDRLGAACDFMISDYANQMHILADWINENLNFDRMYFYGPDRPIHISVGPDNSKFIQIMGKSKTGKRVPRRRGTMVKFSELWDE